MMNSGVVAINVEAMPILVYWTDSRESQMPKNGPITAAEQMAVMALPSLSARRIFYSRPIANTIIQMATVALTMRTNEAFSGGMLSLMPTFAIVKATACASDPPIPSK